MGERLLANNNLGKLGKLPVLFLSSQGFLNSEENRKLFAVFNRRERVWSVSLHPNCVKGNAHAEFLEIDIQLLINNFNTHFSVKSEVIAVTSFHFDVILLFVQQ